MGDTITIDLSGAPGEVPALFVEEAKKELRGRKVIYGKFEAGDNKLIKTV